MSQPCRAQLPQPRANPQKSLHFVASCCDKKSRPEAAKSLKRLAGGLGFEPRLAESESAVLPLDDPPTVSFEAAAEKQLGPSGSAQLVSHTVEIG